MLNANRVVPSERLIDELFGEGLPSALNSVHAGISRLRRQLTEAGVPEFRSSRARPATSSSSRLDNSTSRCSSASSSEGDASSTRAPGTRRDASRALDLWRGPPLADIARYPFARTEISRLEDLRLAAITERIEADLACGRHAEVVGELEALVAEYPLQERLRGLLMLALYRSGRQADALQTYQDTRRLLVAELGLEPSAELRGLRATDPGRRVTRPDSGGRRAGGCRRAGCHVAALVTAEAGDVRDSCGGLAAACAAVIGVVVVAPTDNSPAGVVASSGSVALIDPQANRVAAAIHVGGETDADRGPRGRDLGAPSRHPASHSEPHRAEGRAEGRTGRSTECAGGG